MENKNYTIRCPECHTKVTIERPTGINVQNNPEYKAKILNGSLFNEKCPKCGQNLQIVSRIAYHDMEKRLMLYFRPITSKEDLESFDYDSIKSAIEDNFKVQGYSVRVVTTVNELMEKIKIAEFGLNDGIIEIAKFVYFDIFTRQFEGIGVLNIYYERHDGKDSFIFFCNDGTTRSIALDKKIYDSIGRKFSQAVNLINTSRVCMVGRDWAMRVIKAYSSLEKDNASEAADDGTDSGISEKETQDAENN